MDYKAYIKENQMITRTAGKLYSQINLINREHSFHKFWYLLFVCFPASLVLSPVKPWKALAPPTNKQNNAGPVGMGWILAFQDFTPVPSWRKNQDFFRQHYCRLLILNVYFHFIALFLPCLLGNYYNAACWFLYLIFGTIVKSAHENNRQRNNNTRLGRQIVCP